ncbi:tetratricopeptide repeat protein [Streptomyces sp. NPDC058001]|uniref:serine/threonine protein kinase n=1 Tax=Streptomyces sp. NPDC058001 TaxID=3346300 RepID=UPI0036E65B57
MATGEAVEPESLRHSMATVTGRGSGSSGARPDSGTPGGPGVSDTADVPKAPSPRRPTALDRAAQDTAALDPGALDPSALDVAHLDDFRPAFTSPWDTTPASLATGSRSRSRPRPAHVTLPPEDADPTVLPDVALEVRAASRGAAPDETLSALRLPPDRLLAGQYRVVSQLGYGGMGHVYLAHDTKVDHREVAIKFLRSDGETDTQSNLVSERRALVDLHHDDIIRVFNYGHHAEVGDFLVLQYVEGLTLGEIRERARATPADFGRARYHEFVLAYGVRVLAGLGHLHAQGKVYGDLKPDNLMHDGTTTKFIDVGSVRKQGASGPTTPKFRAPTVGPRGESTGQDDLFSLGETLRTLCGLGRKPKELDELSALDRLGAPGSPVARAARRMTGAPPTGLGLVSLARVLHRATRVDRAERFATAEEMEQQLRGVFRELRSLRTGQETFEPSPLFHQSPYALDGELGAAPPLSRWATDATPTPPPPRTAAAGPPPGTPVPLYPAPTPADVAQRLPVPQPDPHDAHYAEIRRLTDDDPAALLQHVDRWPATPEVLLLRCRLRLRVAVRAAPGYAEYAAQSPDLAAAHGELRRAENALGPKLVRYDWRIDWHRGLLALAQGDVSDARDHFDRVYAAIPGEYAPKLALGYCAEQLADWDAALTFYEAVRLRNPSLGGAAFGTARARLQQGGAASRELAIKALHAVPRYSRHRTAARTAAVRIGVDHTRDAAELGVVLGRLGRLFHEHGLTDEQARLRMKADVWETAHALLADRRLDAAGLAALAADADERLGFPDHEKDLRTSLARFYQGLAQQAARSDAGDDNGLADLAERLLDRAYEVRPPGFRHHRDDRTWLGKRTERTRKWLRSVVPVPAAERTRTD